VLVATPLTPDTHLLIDARALAAMKTGAGLINVGRAGVVDYAELANALKSGKLSGAILDVFDPEPLPASSPLWQVPNLIITPHCSSDDLDHYLPLTLDLAFANVARLRDGKRLKNAVDPATGY
jgi:phosphoglycerate dehydrogenase-like enzyme